MEVQLAHEAATVFVDGFHTDFQQIGDILVTATRPQQLQNLLLALRHRVELGFAPQRFSCLYVAFKDIPGNARADILLALQHAADANPQLITGGVLGGVVVCFGFESLQHVLVGFMDA